MLTLEKKVAIVRITPTKPGVNYIMYKDGHVSKMYRVTSCENHDTEIHAHIPVTPVKSQWNCHLNKQAIFFAGHGDRDATSRHFYLKSNGISKEKTYIVRLEERESALEIRNIAMSLL